MELPTPLVRRISQNISDQHNFTTCYIHTIAKVITRFAVVELNLFDDKIAIDTDDSVVLVHGPKKDLPIFVKSEPKMDEYMVKDWDVGFSGSKTEDNIDEVGPFSGSKTEANMDEVGSKNVKITDDDYSVAEAHCYQFIFDDSVSRDLLFFLESIEDNEKSGIFCDRKTKLVGILYRIIYRILLANHEEITNGYTTDGGYFEEIKYVFDEFRELTYNDNYELFKQAPHESYFSEKFLSLKEKVLVGKIAKASESDREKLANSIKEIKDTRDQEKAFLVEPFIEHQKFLSEKYEEYFKKIFVIITNLQDIWFSNKLIVAQITAKQMKATDGYARNFLKYILEKGLYAGVTIYNTQTHDAHIMTIVGMTEDSYLIKNSWGNDNSYEKIMTDGKIPIELIDNRPYDKFGQDLHVSKYGYDVVSDVNFILTMKDFLEIPYHNNLFNACKLVLNDARLRSKGTFATLVVEEKKNRSKYTHEPPKKYVDGPFSGSDFQTMSTSSSGSQKLIKRIYSPKQHNLRSSKKRKRSKGGTKKDRKGRKFFHNLTYGRKRKQSHKHRSYLSKILKF